MRACYLGLVSHVNALSSSKPLGERHMRALPISAETINVEVVNQSESAHFTFAF